MNAKALLIPLAAFAVTVTGVSAYNNDVLKEVGLTDEQISAFEEARDLREEGDRSAARDVLANAGIDLATLENIREAMHEHRDEMHQAIDDAVAAGDYSAFQEAIKDSPLSDIVTSEDDFKTFVEAYNLRKEGDFAGARELMDELGIDHPLGFGEGVRGPMKDLTDEQKTALAKARDLRRSGDAEGAKQVLADASITPPAHPPFWFHGHGHHFGKDIDN